MCRLIQPTFKFFNEEKQQHQTFCRVCFYSTDVKSSDETIEQLNLIAGVRNFE
jgi:hypothetical protein